MRSLATFGPRARDLVVAATRDRDANTRIAAAQSLYTVLDSNVVSWKPLWTADTSTMYRSSLLASAARAGAMLPELVTWQGHPNWHYRAAALSAAGGLPNTRLARQIGSEMTSDTDPRVRAVAYSVVAGEDSTVPAATREALLRGLVDRTIWFARQSWEPRQPRERRRRSIRSQCVSRSSRDLRTTATCCDSILVADGSGRAASRQRFGRISRAFTRRRTHSCEPKLQRLRSPRVGINRAHAVSRMDEGLANLRDACLGGRKTASDDPYTERR